MELETFIMMCARLGYVSATQTEDVLARITELSKMLTSLRRRLNEGPL